MTTPLPLLDFSYVTARNQHVLPKYDVFAGRIQNETRIERRNFDRARGLGVTARDGACCGYFGGWVGHADEVGLAEGGA
jgi:hypothetical protein